nr:FecR family protein [Lysobacter sp. CAU 1642]
MRRRRWPLAVAAALLACAVLGPVLHAYRLHWQDGAAWSVRGADSVREALAPGGTLRTGAGQRLEVSIARIGALWLSPDSQLAMLRTAPGGHRVRLDHGHLRARVWAPPGYFGVNSGQAEVIDLGCDFDLWVEDDRSGRVAVRSGWIVMRLAGVEQTVPAGHVLHFDATRPGIPLRDEAPAPLGEVIGKLDAGLASGALTPAERGDLVAAILAGAEDADAFTLLSLLTRHPDLAAGPLYPRLAQALGGAQIEPAHRQRWVEGDAEAMHAWWRKLPVPPKQWWRYWRDGFDAWIGE